MTQDEMTKFAEVLRASHSPVAPSNPPLGQGVGILKWVAGIVAGVTTAIIVAVILYLSTTIRAHEKAIAQLTSNAEKTQALREQSDTILNAKLDRIEANTKDRITRAETMREINDVKQEVSRVNDKTEKALMLLTERVEFMTDTRSLLKDHARELKTLQEHHETN